MAISNLHNIEQVTSLRIGVDAHVLSGKFQGSRTYLLNLYQEVLRLDKNTEYMFFGHWDGSAPFGPAAQHVDFPSHSRWKRLTFQTAPIARKFGIDIFHSNFISPIYLPCYSLLTIHDLLFETHSQYFEKKQEWRNKLLVQFAARQAAQIHTVSEFSRQAILDLYRIPSHMVKIIPNGVDLQKFTPEGRATSASLIAERLGLTDYILTVGRLEPRKNHCGLLNAYKMLKNEKPEVGPLVVVGQRDFGFQAFFKTLQALGLEKVVHVLENVSDNLLPDVYRAARMFVYPSFAEGFGIPPLEAMACGVPVVSSNTTSMPEVIGEAGVLIDPARPEEIGAAMFKIISDSKLAESMAVRGRVQAEKWTWENSARCYIDAIRAGFAS